MFDKLKVHCIAPGGYSFLLNNFDLCCIVELYSQEREQGVFRKKQGTQPEEEAAISEETVNDSFDKLTPESNGVIPSNIVPVPLKILSLNY